MQQLPRESTITRVVANKQRPSLAHRKLTGSGGRGGALAGVQVVANCHAAGRPEASCSSLCSGAYYGNGAWRWVPMSFELWQGSRPCQCTRDIADAGGFLWYLGTVITFDHSKFYSTDADTTALT